MIKRLVALLLVVAVAGVAWVTFGGWHPWRGDTAPRFERRSVNNCPGDRPDPWLSQVAVDGTLVTVTQTDAGVAAGARDPDGFADLVLDCLVRLGGDAELLRRYLPNMSCELWLHNLSIVARDGDGRTADALRRVPGLAGVLDRGRPIDMNTDAWAGNVRGRPWDGRPSVCAAVRRVLLST